MADIQALLRDECEKLSIALQTYQSTAAHERALAERWRESNDPKATAHARAALERAPMRRTRRPGTSSCSSEI
jgi:hypothetical protein